MVEMEGWSPAGRTAGGEYGGVERPWRLRGGS